MLPVVCAPSATVVATITATESAIASIATGLVAAGSLMTKSTQASILVTLTPLQVTWIATKALLMRLWWETLSTLSLRVVRRRSRAARLSSKCRWAGSVFGVTEGLQRIFTAGLLSSLLLTIGRVLTRVTLGSTENIRKSTESTCRSPVLIL